ncbi:RrF2 family transcriptional regulator [Ideonella livida]|uniref:Rrf2 family transcriptional regulator n=1 Tax=Ideonella livida TaxID=2707176 RepID=A0A7C9TL98_9BURK|nr:Rrf2 family transcriptional regulator [Ideonella livida]NDY93038.1 Rrf2 family transcriptional regulator [Ideonella livida]
MRLTAMTDYALRLLMYLGGHPARLCTIAEVAQAHGLSEAHLMKITHQLGLAGWITTVRGKGGGMTLARPPAEINLGAFVRSVEPDFQLVECMGAPASPPVTGPNERHCLLTGQCRLAGVFDEALRGFLTALDRRTLADVLPRQRAGTATVAPPQPRTRTRVRAAVRPAPPEA